MRLRPATLHAALLLGLVVGGRPPASAEEDPAALRALREMPKWDAHFHLRGFGSADPAPYIALLDKLNMRALAIGNFGAKGPNYGAQLEVARDFHRRYPERIAWTPSFKLEGWGTPSWEREALEVILDGLSREAVGVKVWKDVGMELKDADGRYVMIDDPRFKALLDLIAAEDGTLIAHIAEPRNCWLALEQMTVEGDRRYFSAHPEYHAYLHPELPRHEELMAARDRVLARHPRLRVVGCHLGSLEFDTDELAKTLDRYPNFAVDMSARIVHFQVQDREKVRAFLLKYQDRVLYGTDGAAGAGRGVADFDLMAQVRSLAEVYERDFRYFATDAELELSNVKAGHRARGLALPEPVLRKLFCENARRWFPALN